MRKFYFWSRDWNYFCLRKKCNLELADILKYNLPDMETFKLRNSFLFFILVSHAKNFTLRIFRSVLAADNCSFAQFQTSKIVALNCSHEKVGGYLFSSAFLASLELAKNFEWKELYLPKTKRLNIRGHLFLHPKLVNT